MRREQVLQTERLRLTTWHPDDVDDLWAVHRDPDTMRVVRHGRPETRAETAELVAGYIAEHQSAGYTKWRLADHDDRLVGRAGFGHDARGRSIAYTIRRDLWGRGLATEIARALVGWHAAHAPGVDLLGVVAVGNPASARVLVTAGFVPVGTEEHSGMTCEIFRCPAHGRSAPTFS